ncbi:MAG: hypothetical protein KAX49_11725 [Halanaerobiales bacterium]|nr:hypothetical protein [Halanaerobiales bacterium]
MKYFAVFNGSRIVRSLMGAYDELAIFDDEEDANAFVDVHCIYKSKPDYKVVEVKIIKKEKSIEEIIMDIIKELEEEYGWEIGIYDIIDKAIEQRINEEITRDVIEKLKMVGILWSPMNNFIRRTEAGNLKC